MLTNHTHQVAKSKITTSGTYVPPKSHPQGSAQPTVVSGPQAVSTIKQLSAKPQASAQQSQPQHISTAGIFVPPNGSGEDNGQLT